MLLRLTTVSACILYCTLIAWGAQAASFQKGDTLLRARAVLVQPQEDGTIRPIGGKPYISPALIPGVDVVYFLTDYIAAEATLGIIPHKAKVKASKMGDRDGGRIYAVAPTVLLQYHREIAEGVKPYLGMGMAYVKYFSANAPDDIHYTDDVAAIVQAGMDVKLDEKWYANMDVKKAWVGTHAKVNGGQINADIDINPVVYSVGLGYKW